MYSQIILILILPPIVDIKLEDVPLSEMTERWQRGDVSNYDYLLYLNKYVLILQIHIYLFNHTTGVLLFSNVLYTAYTVRYTSLYC